MSRVLGIDLNTFAVDLVALDETEDIAEWVRVPLRTDKEDALTGLRRVPIQMPPRSFYDDIYLAAIEAPYGTNQAGTQAKLNRIFGAVVASLPNTLETWIVMPGDWRKGLGLKGNASKSECADVVLGMVASEPRTLPRTPWPQDALDAYAVAYYARAENARALTTAP